MTHVREEVEQIPTERVPLLCVEVLSPEDRLQRVLARVEDFHRMGVAVVWVFDPATEKVWASTAAGAEEGVGVCCGWRGRRLRWIRR